MTHCLDPMTAFRRSERILAEQIAQWEPLEFGVAFTASAFTGLPEANQLREVWLADIDGETVFARAEEHYTKLGLTCRRWTPASGQTIEPVESLLLSKGWRRAAQRVFEWTGWTLLHEDLPTDVRVLPARAMPKAYRATFETEDPLGAVRASAAVERLNDANLDGFVATVGGQPAGRVSYLSVGDAARICDLSVLPAYRRQGVGRAMMQHVLQLARRLLPKVVVAACPADQDESASDLSTSGFTPIGCAMDYLRN